jgi:hypothetical protein
VAAELVVPRAVHIQGVSVLNEAGGIVPVPRFTGLSGSSVKRPNRCKIEVFTAVTMKNGVFWDVTSCGSCKNRR